MEDIQKITLLGAGNVGVHLAHAIAGAGLEIVQIYNRTPEPGMALANKYSCPWCADIEKIETGADLYILALSNKGILSVTNRLQLKDELTVHTSGSLDMQVLGSVSKNIGVLYPLQTFTKQRDIDFRKAPLCVEANSHSNTLRLIILARRLSDAVFQYDSKQRKALHLAAVFACNFSNYLYSVSEEILRQDDIPFDILAPLIHETAEKAIAIHPKKAQTGPALRNEREIIEAHLQMLDRNPAYKKMYAIFTEMIHKTHNRDDKL